MKEIKYVRMTVKEASKIMKEDATVLVAITDLESDDCNMDFKKKKFGECKGMINNAETIAKLSSELVDQLRLFSKEQEDVINYRPVGSLSTILLSKGNNW